MPQNICRSDSEMPIATPAVTSAKSGEMPRYSRLDIAAVQRARAHAEARIAVRLVRFRGVLRMLNEREKDSIAPDKTEARLRLDVGIWRLVSSPENSRGLLSAARSQAHQQPNPIIPSGFFAMFDAITDLLVLNEVSTPLPLE